MASEQRGPRAVGLLEPALVHRADELGDLLLGQPPVALVGDDGDAGKIRRVMSGPPVAESSSAAS